MVCRSHTEKNKNQKYIKHKKKRKRKRQNQNKNSERDEEKSVLHQKTIDSTKTKENIYIFLAEKNKWKNKTKPYKKIKKIQ